MTFNDQTSSGRDPGVVPQQSEGNGSTVFPGDLLSGRSSAERIAFLARPAPAERPAPPTGPRPRVYRNYTRRLRDI